MKKPIEDDAFWLERLEQAKRDGKDWHSVYYTHTSDWEEICRAHEPIVREETRGKTVLDAGCGYGRASEWCADASAYTGVDMSPSLLKEAHERYPTETFMQADLRNLPFKNGEFDIAIAISIREMVIENLGIDEWKKMLRELHRVAKKVLLLEYEA